MYHQMPSAIITVHGHSGWYVMADIPIERSSHFRIRSESDRLDALVIEEWGRLEPALDPETRITSEALNPSYHTDGDWWAGYLLDIVGVIEDRQGKRSTTRKVLCAYLDSAAWRTIEEFSQRPGAPVSDRWSGQTKRSFIQEEAERQRVAAERAERMLEGSMTLADLQKVEAQAEHNLKRARDMLARWQASEGIAGERERAPEYDQRAQRHRQMEDSP